MSHTTHHHHKKKTEDEPEKESKPEQENPSGKYRLSSTGEEVALSEEEFRKLKLFS